MSAPSDPTQSSAVEDDAIDLHDIEPSVEENTEPTYTPDRVAAGPAGLRTDLPLWRVVIGLAIWPLLEQLMGATVWFVDSALAGHLPPDIVKPASDAVGAAVYFMWLMGLLQGAVGVGATAIISRCIGGSRFDEAKRATGQAVMLALSWGFFNAILFWMISYHVGDWLSLGPEGSALCQLYLQILAVAAPLRAILFIGAACLRGAGDTRSPFFVMLVVNIVNIIASIALVAEWSPIGGYGVAGIAWGTFAAWMIGGLIMLSLLIRGAGFVRLEAREMRPDPPMIWRLLRIGVPALFESGGHWLGNFVVIWMVGYLAKIGLESHPLGAHNFAIRIEGFSFLPGFAFNIAAATLAGQYLGAGDVKTARRAILWAWLFGAGFMTFFGLLLIVFPEQLVRLVTNEPEFLESTPQLLFIAGFAQLGFGTAMVLSGAIRGAGDTAAAMKITFISTFLIRIPAAWFFGIYLGYGLNGIWIALSGELCIRGLLFLGRFLGGEWAEKEV